MRFDSLKYEIDMEKCVAGRNVSSDREHNLVLMMIIIRCDQCDVGQHCEQDFKALIRFTFFFFFNKWFDVEQTFS